MVRPFLGGRLTLRSFSRIDRRYRWFESTVCTRRCGIWFGRGDHSSAASDTSLDNVVSVLNSPFEVRRVESRLESFHTGSV